MHVIAVGGRRLINVKIATNLVSQTRECMYPQERLIRGLIQHQWRDFKISMSLSGLAAAAESSS